MDTDISDVEIENLLSEDIGCAFFVGSAISVWSPSKAPSAQQMKNAIILTLYSLCNNELKTRIDINPLINNNQPRLEWIFEELEGYFGSSILSIMNCYNLGKPNSIHKLLIRNILSKKILRLYTTNQDVFIEKQFVNEGYQQNKDFKIILPNGKIIEDENSAVRIIKLHGSIENRESIRTSLREIGLGISTSLAELLIKDLAKLRFVFLGYSGLDIDIQETLLRSSPKEIIWLEKPYTNTDGHFANKLRVSGKKVELIPFDIASIIPTRTNTVFNNVLPYLEFIQNIFKYEIKIKESEAAHILGKYFRLISDNYQLNQCISSSLTQKSEARQLWYHYYLKAQTHLYNGRIISENIRAFFYYFYASKLAKKENYLNGYSISKIGMGLATDMLFYGGFSIIYLMSLLGIYLPLYNRQPFKSIDRDENHFLKYEVLFYIGRCLFRLRRYQKSKKIFLFLVNNKFGHRHILAHSLRYLGTIYSLNRNTYNAIDCFEKSILEFEFRQMYVEIADVNRMMAMHYLRNKNYSNAKEKTELALEVYSRYNNYRGIHKSKKLMLKLDKKKHNVRSRMKDLSQSDLFLL